MRPYDGMYSGVCDRAKITRQLPEYNGPAESNDDGDNGNDDPIDGGDFAVSSKKKRKNRAYSSCEREFKRILVKWGNHPMVLQQFFDMTRASSKPTQQASRSHRR